MLHLILGRAGTGKSTAMLDLLCENGRRRPQLYLVPEQYSHETERRLCQAGGDGTSLYSEVLSFSRLASRVFAKSGGLSVPVLDGGGRLLLMHRALRSVESQLQLYRRPAKEAAFLTQMLATADELKSYSVRPEQLLEAAEDGQEEREKLADLGLILSAYDALVAQRAADPRDQLTRLADALQTSGYLKGHDIYVDCFTDFTPQERNVLAQALRQANSLTVALTCDTLNAAGGLPAFEPARRTVQALLRMAQGCGSTVEVTWLRERASGWTEELNLLEEGLYGEAVPWEGETGAVTLVCANTPFDQAEFAAGEILKLVRERGLRWREIGVAVRSMDGWEDLLEQVFRRWKIPVFLNRMTDILQKPVLTLITAALDAVSGGYSYDDLFRYLKTGLTGLAPEERDKLENYVLKWDIRGKKWVMEAPWSWHPEGYALPWTEGQREEVARLDELRREVIAPLEHLKASGAKTGRDHTLALYAFLEEIQLPQCLTCRAEKLQRLGQLNQAEEYAQLWGILCGALEQCAQLLGDEPMELEEFSQLFQLVLSQYDVGAIPVSLDRVAVGDAPRMAHKNLRALIVLGAEDTAFPLVSPSAGLLTDEDRERLNSRGLELAPTASQRLERELTIVYDLFTLPRERLVVCRSVHSAAGEEYRPAFVYTRLEELFPRCRREYGLDRATRLMSPEPALEELARTRDEGLLAALEQLPDCRERVRRLARSFEFQRGQLSPGAVERLYGEKVRLSASKMDKLKGCHFSYFMQYGLKAKPRRAAGFDAPEAGTFVHYVLEWVLRWAGEEGGVKACSPQRLEELTRRAVEEYIRLELGGVEDKPQRFRYLFRRLLKSVRVVVDNVVEELRSSQFEPIDFELGFGAGSGIPVEVQTGELTLSITGFVDRVDGWIHDGRLYYRVMDYKTGLKSFDFTDVWNGLGLQMLIYLFALQEKGEQVWGQRDPIPAGVLYLPAREVMVSGSRTMAEGQVRKETDRQLRRSGLLLNDAQVLEAMEAAGQEGIRFLPVRVLKGGKLSGDALAGAEEMGRLKRHLERILQQIGREFAGGNVNADPYFRGSAHSACDYCEFAASCQFEEERGDCRRYLATVKAGDFWQRLKELDEKEGK